MGALGDRRIVPECLGPIDYSWPSRPRPGFTTPQGPADYSGPSRPKPSFPVPQGLTGHSCPSGPRLGFPTPQGPAPPRAAVTHRGSTVSTPLAALHRSPARSRLGSCWTRRQTRQAPRSGHSYPGTLQRHMRRRARVRSYSNPGAGLSMHGGRETRPYPRACTASCRFRRIYWFQ